MSDADKILSAIAALADRAGGMEDRFGRLEAGFARLEKQVAMVDQRAERIEHRVNAIARTLLSAGECVALGIADGRESNGGGSPAPGHLAMAASGE